jgi:hypothetical protein
VQLKLNVETSVAGYVVAGVEEATPVVSLTNAAPVPADFTIDKSDPIKGSSVDAVVSWGGRIGSLSSFAGKQVKVTLAMADAKVFAIRMECAAK